MAPRQRKVAKKTEMKQSEVKRELTPPIPREQLENMVFEDDEECQVVNVKLGQVHVDEDGNVPNAENYNRPIPPVDPNNRMLYEVGTEPLDEMPRVIDATFSMDDYFESQTELINLGEGNRKLSDAAKKLLYTLVHNRPVLWQGRNILVKKDEWELIGLEIARRLGTIYTVARIRKEWGYLKQKVKERLTRYIQRNLNDPQVEAEFLKDPLYIYYRFYRSVVREYEDQLRRKINGEEYDEAVLEQPDDEELILIGVFKGTVPRIPIGPVGGELKPDMREDPVEQQHDPDLAQANEGNGQSPNSNTPSEGVNEGHHALGLVKVERRTEEREEEVPIDAQLEVVMNQLHHLLANEEDREKKKFLKTFISGYLTELGRKDRIVPFEMTHLLEKVRDDIRAIRVDPELIERMQGAGPSGI